MGATALVQRIAVPLLASLVALTLSACGGSAATPTTSTAVSDFPRPHTAFPELEPVIEAWAGSVEFHELNPPGPTTTSRWSRSC
jgi:hypothetical protein